MKNIASKVLLFMTVFILFYITLTVSDLLAIKNFKLDTIVSNKEVNEINEEQELALDKDKVAYITIDDGPSKYTNQILNILEANDVKATFFMINKNMNQYKEVLDRTMQEGHSIGFHSVSHDVNILYKDINTTVGEFDTCKETLYKLTGKESRLIRLPYGSKPYASEKTYNRLKSEGYQVWDWNIDSEDWKGTKDKIVSNILYYGKDKEKLVILIHEKEQTVESLNSIIRILKERGYKIVPITEDNEPMNFWEKNLF